MTMQTLSLSALEASNANPRRKFDAKTIEGLASSIKTDGLLQNLVVSPVEGKRNRFRIISGERRFRAMKLLEQRGELPDDFTVPVEVRKQLSKDDSLRISTVENLQRQNLTPLEETAALTKLIHKRVTLDDLVAQTGLSASTIKRRLALNSLCKEAKAALSEGEITLAQAEALTLGGDETQQRILDEIGRGHEFSADGIREVFLDAKPSVALAIFPLEQYTGTITTDLFAEEETSYFDDAEEFYRLQREAVAQLAKHHQAAAAWVEVTEDYRIPEWQYRKAKKREKGGTIINISPSGRVEIREGLVKKVDEQTAKALAENPAAAKKPKAAYSAPLCRYIAWHKSVAVQESLLTNPRKAREVMAVDSLVGLSPHEGVQQLAKQEERGSAYAAIEAQARLVAGWLGFEIVEDKAFWIQFPPRGSGANALYEAVGALDDNQLDQLLALVTALRFGQIDCTRLDASDTLFNRVARDLAVDMRNVWRPGRGFLERRNREQLLAIAQECGCAEVHSIGMLRTYKKSELVVCLLNHFEKARMAVDSTPAQLKAREWLPDAMLFPAINPDAPPNVELDDEMPDEDKPTDEED